MEFICLLQMPRLLTGTKLYNIKQWIGYDLARQILKRRWPSVSCAALPSQPVAFVWGRKRRGLTDVERKEKKLCTESNKHMIEPNKGRLSSSKTGDSIHRPLCPEPCLFSTVADETRHYVFLYTWYVPPVMYLTDHMPACKLYHCVNNVE